MATQPALPPGFVYEDDLPPLPAGFVFDDGPSALSPMATRSGCGGAAMLACLVPMPSSLASRAMR